jgi:hypothetical protein
MVARTSRCVPGSPEVALIDVAGRNPDVDTPAELDTLEGSSS